MARKRLICAGALAALGLPLALFSVPACSSDGKPSSLVTGSGGSSSSAGGHTGMTAGSAGSGGTGASSGGSGASDSGADNEAGASAMAMPSAAFPSELEADVGCNMVTPDASLLIRNIGDEPLEVSSASASAGYTVKTTLPLEIAPGAGANLLVTPPAPRESADAGAVSTGKLSFTTNEPGTPTHDVKLTTTVFEGTFEFTDSNGSPVTSVKLAYDDGGACPSLTKYRIHNTGNVTFTVAGPTFPAHFGGTTLGPTGQDIPPDGYAELIVGAVSTPGTACSGAGDLSFTVMGTFCGAVPKLSLTWPQSTDPDAGSSCACTVPAL